MDIAFSGAGFMGCYYFGVIDCWNKHIPRDRINRVAGTSAGALSGAYYIMDLPLLDCLREIIELTESVRKRPLGVFDRSNQIVDLLPKLLDRIFPEDAHKRCSGKLYVCMTRMKDMKKVLVNEFETRKDLIDALNCSCFIPVWSGNHVPTFKGVKHIDGGFSDGLPVFDEHTIRVCPFSGSSDISPYDRAIMELLHVNVIGMPMSITLNNCRRVKKSLFPPTIPDIMELLERGFHDTKDFILSYDLIQCNTCYNKTDLQNKPIFKQLSPTITPSVSPAISRTCSFRDLANMSPPIEEVIVSDMLEEEENNNENIGKENKEMDSNKAVENNNRENKLPVDDYSMKGEDKQIRSKDNDSFTCLLRDKLQRSCSPDSIETIPQEGNQSSTPTSDDQNNNNNNNNSNVAPTIVVSNDSLNEVQENRRDRTDSGAFLDTGLSSSSSSSSSTSSSSLSPPLTHENQCKKDALNDIPTKQFLLPRRKTIQQENNLLVVQDKFIPHQSPLPSCPPSPNLNRHCSECLRMRQEARLDRIGDNLMVEADKRCSDSDREIALETGGFRNKLASPFRWIKQLGKKTSYKFEDPAKHLQQQQQSPTMAR